MSGSDVYDPNKVVRDLANILKPYEDSSFKKRLPFADNKDHFLSKYSGEDSESSFACYGTTNLNKVSWSRKHKRAYGRFISGINRAKALGETLRFLTLTSSQSSQRDDLNYNFNRLVRDLRHGKKVRSKKTKKWIWDRRPCKFQYCKIRTHEGFGVIHAIFRGSFIKQSIIKGLWYKYNKAFMVDVRKVWDSPKKVAGYLIGNYLMHHTFFRMAWSVGWIFKGWLKKFKHMIRFNGFKKGILFWQVVLKNRDIDKAYMQLKLH